MGMTGPTQLSEQERAVLDLERRWWKHAGAKEQVVREILGLSITRYAQLLNALVDTERALAADPVTVGRVRRLRDRRLRLRAPRSVPA